MRSRATSINRPGEVMKFFLIGLVLGIPGLIPGTEEGLYRIAALSEVAREILKTSPGWKTCGDYFAAAESKKGKIVYFAFEGSLDNEPSTFDVPMPSQIAVRINNEAAIPVITVRRGIFDRPYYTIWMNLKDYTTGFPCFGKGTNT